METSTTLLNQVSSYDILGMAGLAAFIIICILVFILIGKTEQVKELKVTVNRLVQSFSELDEQAKLIVKTDLELNKIQEELDRRLDGLNVLQKTSRLISTTLNEDEIFDRLSQPLMTDLRFEKNLIFLYDENKKLHCRTQSGFSKEEVIYIGSKLETDRALNEPLSQGQTFSSVSSSKQKKEKIQQLCEIEHFVLAPILSQEGIIGVLLVGNQSNTRAMTEGDEELLTILANQIGQSLENSRLFEQVYRSRQELELKIQERTKQLESALEKVQNISKTKSEFISAVSHELRTPLTSIKGYAAILMAGKIGAIPAQVKERLEKINKHSDNLVQLINNLLDISRIESGRVTMEFKNHVVGTLVDNVRDLLTPQIKEKDINFLSRIGKDLPQIPCDRNQIERVFINLISNAVKFTPAKGTITVDAKPNEDGAVEFTVADTGIGIKQDDIEKLFEEFYRVENEINQNVKGTGLGLPLAKKIVEAHGGKMWVTSKVGEGTTFHFILPLKRTELLAKGDQ